MSPSVSVILYCRNHQAYVHEAVDSILSQTLSDFEIIAIDDGSEDETYSILESVDDPRFQLVQHGEPQGLAKTINEGIRRSKGTYISILNADDLYHSKRLEYCLETTEENDLILLGTDIDLLVTPDQISQATKSAWLECYGGLKGRYLQSRDLTSTLISGNLFISSSNLFCRRSLFDTLGPLKDDPYVQAYDFLLRCLVAFPEKIHWSEHRMLAYRLHEDKRVLHDPLAASRQTLETLAHWIPHLAHGPEANERLETFEQHVIGLSQFIEWSATHEIKEQWQTEAIEYEKGIQERNTALVSLREETAKKLDSAESQRAKSKQREHELESELALTQAELETSHQNISSLKSEQASNDAALRASKQREATSLSYTQTLTHQLNQTTTHLEEHQEVLESLNASASYRLGYALLQPFRLCRAIAQKVLEWIPGRPKN